MFEKDDILQREELKKAPLSVPEGYFDSLPERVMQRIAAGDKQPARRVPLRKWWMAAAAACAVTVAALAIRLTNAPVTEQTAYEDDAEYIELMDIDERSLAEYGSEEEQDDISQDAIIEYLAYNGLGSAYLYEQLAEAE
jgi:hypothetical protein